MHLHIFLNWRMTNKSTRENSLLTLHGKPWSFSENIRMSHSRGGEISKNLNSWIFFFFLFLLGSKMGHIVKKYYNKIYIASKLIP